jgi:uncharacterized protein YqjF (DUF2071 family)
MIPLAADVEPGPVCPRPVADATMLHRWDELTFLHWRYPPDVVQRLLPPGLTVETFAGSAWVGLVPFRMVVTRPGWPTPPWAGRFPETNVRTYVRGPDGRTGVWFLSLDAARLGAVILARQGFALPYFWSDMAVTRVGRTVTYRSRRRWPRPPAHSHVEIEVGERHPAGSLRPLDHWLTARWQLYAASPRGLSAVAADHPPWPLYAARARRVDDGLVVAAGLPRPEGEPLVHWSPGVPVRIGPRFTPVPQPAGDSVSASTQAM